MADAVVHQLRSLSIYEEPDGSFAVDHYSTPGDFLAIPAEANGFQWTPNQPMESPGLLQQYKHGRSTKELGPRSLTASFTVPMGLTGILADDVTASADEDDSALFRLLKIVFGGIIGGNMGSTVATPDDEAGFDVQAGHGTRFNEVGAIGWINANGLMEIREIQRVVSDTITLKHALSGIPQATDAIYNATTFYLDDGNTHAQFIATGQDANDAWSLRGCQLSSLAYRTALAGVPGITFGMQGAEWENKGGGALAGATYANFNPFVFNEGELFYQTVGTETRNVVCAREVQFNPALSYIAKTCVNGTNTIDGYVQDHGEPVIAGSFGVHYEDQSYFTDRTNKTPKHIALQIGMQPTGGWLIVAPNAQITDATSPQDANRLAGQTVSFEGGIDTDVATQTTASRRSAHRLHIVG